MVTEELRLQARVADIGGLSVRRLLPQRTCRSVGPWVFFDHMGPTTFEVGKGIDVLPHPHINLATVTYLFAGEILHRDSLGSEQSIKPGDINLMIAGSGIVHSERERLDARQQKRELHGLQLWLALPEDDEEMEPDFFHYASSQIPVATIEGVDIRVMIGRGFGVESPVMMYYRTFYAEASLQAGQKFCCEIEEEQVAIYATDAAISVDQVNLYPGEMLVLESGAKPTIAAESAAHVAMLGGEKIQPRHMFWNFISTRKERVEAAKADWRAGRFPKVPGDDQEFVPLPE